MQTPGTVRRWLRPLYYVAMNRISATGAALTTSGALTLITFWFYYVLLPGPPHPYIGILIFLILPLIFVAGLVLMPIGIWLHRRKLRARGELPEESPQLDLANETVRRGLWLAGGLTFVNFAVIGTASYQGVAYMDSTRFCGETCHSVMSPEYTAYQNAPHSRVECVECHVGPGAGGFMRAKLNGLHQVYALALHTYPRPIPSPVENLRPARETCEQCHWPGRSLGDKLLVLKKFQEDEKNTVLATVLVMKLGGSRPHPAGVHGRHLERGIRIEYVALDRERTSIPVVNYTTADGKTTRFASTEIKTTPEQLAKAEHREMDCIDCHNRPAHSFQLPEHAVDAGLAAGDIDPGLPFAKKKSLELLKADYPDRDTARGKIAQGFAGFYQTSYPQVFAARRDAVDRSAEQLAAIYERNIFPSMRLTWGSHPNYMGHMDSLGCFRCHDGSHTSADGQTIPNDCTTCHDLLASDDPHPKILEDLKPQ